MKLLPDWLLQWVAYPLFYRFVKMPGRSYQGPMVHLTPAELMLKDRLTKHVDVLARQIGERSIARPQGLSAAETYIARHLEILGYEVKRQWFDFNGIRMCNLIVEKRGTHRANEIAVIGAHYDTVIGTPGADDNATGVAALLEMARWLKFQHPARTIRLVAFANEEHPGGPWESMGSCVYANSCAKAGDNIVAMLSLEMLGVYSDKPGSQQYPRPFNLFYPKVANFIGFVGNTMSRPLVRECVATFRGVMKFPCEGVSAPDSVKDVGRSDHWAFWQIGVPALMVTDTSNFRYPLYHTGEDTPDKLDFDRFTKVVAGVFAVVAKLGR